MASVFSDGEEGQMDLKERAEGHEPARKAGRVRSQDPRPKTQTSPVGQAETGQDRQTLKRKMEIQMFFCFIVTMYVRLHYSFVKITEKKRGIYGFTAFY